ncbi:Annexin A4 [Holothuria leucospilota]|uniref:Annexin n=1 Tax=Holothuria leucospilota TaxID=206669 RepID=A0A9Q1H5R6_HOLLE|nr:Annexin A4 [Holothuria leucospilota]
MADEAKTPTVRAAEVFNADEDATVLHEAFKGFGTNENAITSIFAGRSLEQRQAIQEAYKSKFEKDLLDDLRSELSGNYLYALEGLISDPADFHAKHIKSIVSELDVISAAYSGLYKVSLLEDVKANVKGPFAAATVAILEGGHDESVPTPDKVKKDVDLLVNLTPEQWTPENNQLMDLFIKNNIFYIFSVLSGFKTATQKDILEIASTAPLPEFREGFKAIVGSAQDQWAFFADQLYMSMKGIGTCDKKLIYIIIFRCETDLKNIENTFQEKYKSSLHNFIRDDTSGDYKNLLIALAGPEEEAKC